MTRFSAALAISICWLLFIAIPAMAQSDQGIDSGEGKCFPWQEYQAGQCVAKSTPPPATAPTPVVAMPCAGGASDASGQCVCPANTHLDAASGNCLADIVTTIRKANDSVVCDGGRVSDGKCSCPAGFNLLPANSNVAGSGTCVRTNAANCLGGDLTVAGTCFCNGRVTMSGETYALELVGGKCVPKRCPLYTYLKDGKCIGTSDKAFGFTCRTGYIPDEANPGTAASGLHCLPDPTFCAPVEKRRNGDCPKSSAVAIDCFEGKCVCGDSHADWVNYLCQCAEPYRNVNGTCVSDVADPGARKPGEKIGSDQSGEPSEETARRHRSCGRGMVRAHAGCVPARRRYPVGVYEGVPPGLAGYPEQYYVSPGSRNYRFKGYSIPQ
jgi:hypothetical protein